MNRECPAVALVKLCRSEQPRIVRMTGRLLAGAKSEVTVEMIRNFRQLARLLHEAYREYCTDAKPIGRRPTSWAKLPPAVREEYTAVARRLVRRLSEQDGKGRLK